MQIIRNLMSSITINNIELRKLMTSPLLRSAADGMGTKCRFLARQLVGPRFL